MHGVEVGVQGPELIDAFLLELAKFLLALRLPFLGAAKFFLQPRDLGLRLVDGELQLLDLLLAGLVLVTQPLEAAHQLLVQLEDLRVRAGGFRGLLRHQADFNRPCSRYRATSPGSPAGSTGLWMYPSQPAA